MNPPPIGGYFELEFPQTRPIKKRSAFEFQTARASLLALLRASNFKRVWMPYYICDAMLDAVQVAGMEACFYSINDHFGIRNPIELDKSDLLLFVNYFGVCSHSVQDVLSQYNASQIVLDCSQAFYFDNANCLACIYSPRKFFGLPDGGLLVSKLSIPVPTEVDQGSQFRMQHLIKRLYGSPESGYPDYLEAEASLSEPEPKQMSKLTRRIFLSIDYDSARIRRNHNFSVLHKSLRYTNLINVELASVDGPLCYPYLCRNNSLKKKLIANRVFIPTYWKEVLSRVSDTSFEKQLVENCLPLPCDQRYDHRSMMRLVDILQSCAQGI